MSTTAKWIIGIVIGLVILMVALPFVWQAVFPNAYGYGMMGYRHMPMTLAPGASAGVGGYGFMPFGMFFVWLIPPGLLVLIALGIAALVKYLTNKPPSSN
jgi:hypothetical protein